MPQKRYRSTFYWQSKQYECASSKSQKDADQKAALKLQALERGEIGISSGMTVRRWAKEWLETYKKPTLAKKQYDDYVSQFDNTVLPAIGNMRLCDVKDIHLQKILNSKSGYSLDRLSKLKNRMNAMFRQAYISNLISRNPAEFLTLPKAENGTHRSITDFEREHFLEVASTHHAGLMFKVMLYCGLRTGEVTALEWRDLDLEKRRIKVLRAVESGTDQIKAPKTKAGIREIPIPDELLLELARLEGEPFAPIFTNPRTKKRYTNAGRNRAWNSLKDAIDVSMGAKFGTVDGKNNRNRTIKILSVVAPDFVPYCLRHTYCTDLQNKGVPINIAKYLMGHSNISVTAKIYTHISDIAIDNAAELINGDNNGKQGCVG